MGKDKGRAMKKMLVSLVLVASMVGVAHAGSIRVQNGDSKNHTVELKCNGSKKKIEIRSSTTTTYTFHSTASSCEIIGGSVKFPTSKMETGQKWKIRNGQAKSY